MIDKNKSFWICSKGHKTPDEGRQPEKCIHCGQTNLKKKKMVITKGK